MNQAHRKSITVLQVIPALDAGGVERGTLEVARELVRAGHKSIVLSAGGRMVAELIRDGSEHVTLPIGTKSPLLLRYVPILRRHISRTDIIHARSRFPAWLAWLAWRSMDRLSRPVFVTSVHGAYSVNAYSRIMTRGERVIAVSDYIRDYIFNNYPDIDRGRIVTIHRGIDPALYHRNFRPAEQWLREWHECFPQLRGKFILTLPGRITRLKGHDHFLRILSALNHRELNIHGLVVGAAHAGKRSYYKSLQQAAAAMNVTQAVTFTGHRDDLREILSISDIVLSLSGQPEAFGRTVLESLCLGTPVIAYDHGGTSEIMKTLFPHGLVQKDNINGVIDRIADFYLASPAISPDNPYLLQTMLDRTIACYEDLAATRLGS